MPRTESDSICPLERSRLAITGTSGGTDRMTTSSNWHSITTVYDDPATGAMVATFAEGRDLLLATRDTEPYLLLVCADSTQ